MGPDTPMRMIKSVLVALTLWIAAAEAAFGAEVVFPPGSRIGLVPPPSMSLARGLAGFQNPATGAGILLVEMPVEAYPGLAASFSDQGLKAQGFTLKSRDKVPVGSLTGLMVTGEQTESGRRSIKTMLLVPDRTMTVLVMGQMPTGTPPGTVADVEKALRTVALRPPLTLDEMIEALPFKIGDLAGYRPIRTVAGSAVLLTDGPRDVVRDADQPTVIIAESFGQPPPPAQRESFARGGLAAHNFVKDAVIERPQSYRQGGVDWHELVAKAKDALSGRDVIVVQTIRFEPDGYIRSVGVVRTENRDEALPRIRRIVDSIAAK